MHHRLDIAVNVEHRYNNLTHNNTIIISLPLHPNRIVVSSLPAHTAAPIAHERTLPTVIATSELTEPHRRSVVIHPYRRLHRALTPITNYRRRIGAH